MPLREGVPMSLKSLALALMLVARSAAAQTTLGELLDAGAQMLSAEQFRQELVQRVLVGATPAGGALEVVYTTNGAIQGVGSPPQAVVKMVVLAPLSGQWSIDENGRVCTSMQISALSSPPTPGVNLGLRCQFWYKRGDQYFISDSDSDRSMRVFRRTLKP